MLDDDESFALYRLPRVCVWQSGCADEWLAAVAGAYAGIDMAWSGTRCAAALEARDRYDKGEQRVPGGRQAVDLCQQRLAADDDGLLPKGKEYGRCGGRVSWRGLSDSRDRSRRHGGLRLADIEAHHVRAAQVPRAGCRVLFEIGTVSDVRAISGITDRVGS